jgi:cardiolipin synthase A/B
MMNMKLVLPPEYVEQAAADVNKATKRVYLISMVIADHPETHELLEAMKKAAERGVSVTVSADVFTYGEVSGSFLPIKYYSPNAKLVTKMVKDLKAAGVKFRWLGHARATFLNGRTHDKWCIVDDTVYAFGGVNMYGESIRHTDYMFRLENAAIADRLANEQQRIIRIERASSNYPSVAHETPLGTILFDGGIITQSVIYRRAVELSREAAHILFVSQYCPTGKLARTLKTKDVTLYFNRPAQATYLNRLLNRWSIFISRLQNSYARQPYLHAKFMIFTMKDGSKIALTGSHNFAYTGVLLGTREVALETKEPAVIRQLEAFHKEHVA